MADAGMAKAGIELAARYLEVPDFYAVKFFGGDATWIGFIDTNPFSGHWQFIPFTNYPGYPFPEPVAEHVEPD